MLHFGFIKLFGVSVRLVHYLSQIVLEPLESLFVVAGHGDVDFSYDTVPIEDDVAALGAWFINFDCVVFFECSS